MFTTEKLMIGERQIFDGSATCARIIIVSLLLIGLTAGSVVLNDWIEGRLVPSEGAVLLLVFTNLTITIRLMCSTRAGA